ncbi:ATP-binding protein [Bradyrhizobium sp. INPA01-394B]|uniref:ATP-binding protein n=1 Tax=Bradyrhizobium campsiandrae TaxID=1729892 RepID=A0ABR7UGG1_9BRAD|nr:ATP-binding protein [Bradyrhizobium campsiandrae]MBC9882938.1 ATP-binding protein [Bradyrhizobium campsiandrae]MBC9982559.1 ATP-binding protein [Bradyrhizobium campsiandrae]
MSDETSPSPNPSVREIELNVGSRQAIIGEAKTISPAFANYVTRNHGFLAHVRDVRDQIETYINKRTARRPLNVLLAAPPGSGKSFLIKQIINSITDKNTAVQVSFEETYIASLESADELFKIFQRVQSLNLEGKIPVVFFDEIDARIADVANVYSKFLAPMWDGTFYVGKEKFFLGKCIFFFAGSGLSLEAESKEAVTRLAKKSKPVQYDLYFQLWKEKFDDRHSGAEFAKQKLPDFLDRIDSVLRIPPICEELLGEQTEAEYDDLACMLIKKHFPAVTLIEKEALDTIRRALKSESSMRTAEKIVFNSTSRIEEEDELFDMSCLPRRHQIIVPSERKEWWKVTIEKPS